MTNGHFYRDSCLELMEIPGAPVCHAQGLPCLENPNDSVGRQSPFRGRGEANSPMGIAENIRSTNLWG